MTQLPPDVYARIRAFLDSGATGRIELHVKEGNIQECVVYTVERVRVERRVVSELERVS
jgi:hypothetical protein